MPPFHPGGLLTPRGLTLSTHQAWIRGQVQGTGSEHLRQEEIAGSQCRCDPSNPLGGDTCQAELILPGLSILSCNGCLHGGGTLQPYLYPLTTSEVCLAV